MRSIVVIAALAGALSLPATTAAATQPANFHFSVTIDAVSTIGGCCSDTVVGETTAAFPRIGRATLTAGFFRCGPSYCFPNGDNFLSLTFVTPSGATLVLGGGATGGTFTASGTWEAFPGGSSGRFGGVTGSGTWSATFTPTGPGGPGGQTPGTLAISISGTLSLASG